MSGDAGRGGEAPYPSERSAWYVIAVLFAATLFSQLDRQLPALLVGPIKQEFAISDTQFGLLQGLAFAGVYTIMGLPFGRLVDRTNRRNLIVVGVLVWSLMTALTAGAGSYEAFFVARMGVGLGEAVLAPAAYSIIADYVRPQRRGFAMGVYYLSLAIGQGASMVLGGVILRLVPEGGVVLPLVGHLEPWRMAFVIAGAPGLLLALMVFSIREPVRRITATAVDKTQGSIREIAAYVRGHLGGFLPIFLCPALMTLIGYGAAAWGPAFYIRRFGMAPADAGVLLGVVIASVGVIGSLAAGWVGDRLVARGVAAGRLRVMLVTWAMILPAAVLWTQVPILWLSVALLGVTVLGLVTGLATVPVMVQDISPNRMRGQVMAIYLLMSGLCGIAAAPVLVGLLTDQVFRDDAAVGWSLSIIAGPAALTGLLLCLSCLRPYARAHAALNPSEGAGAARTS